MTKAFWQEKVWNIEAISLISRSPQDLKNLLILDCIQKPNVFDFRLFSYTDIQ